MPLVLLTCSLPSAMRRLLSVFLLALPLAAQNPALMEAVRDPKEDIYIGKREHIDAGAQLYAIACAGCHGPSGEGGRGPNLVIGPAAQNKKPTQIYTAIKNGVPGGDMPPFGSMPDEQLWQMTAFVSNLSRPAYEVDVPGDAEAGKALYFGKAGCVNCHMIRGKGGALGPDLSNAGLQNYVDPVAGRVSSNPTNALRPAMTPCALSLTRARRSKALRRTTRIIRSSLWTAAVELHLLPTSGLKEIVFLKNTWMPDYTERFSEDELQNILAFVSRQATRVSASDDDTETGSN